MNFLIVGVGFIGVVVGWEFVEVGYYVKIID